MTFRISIKWKYPQSRKWLPSCYVLAAGTNPTYCLLYSMQGSSLISALPWPLCVSHYPILIFTTNNSSCTGTSNSKLAFIGVVSDAVWPESVRRGARSRSPVLLEGTSGCSPGITQATSAPAQSTSASDRLKGVPPSCSPSSLLCSKQQVFSSHGAHPPECSSSVDMVQGTAHLLSAQSDGRNCHLNSIAPAAQIEIAWILKRLCGPEMGCWVASEKTLLFSWNLHWNQPTWPRC